MDDTTSRQQIDELADLYLTDPGRDAGAAAPSPVEGPAPIKLAPKVAAGQHDDAGLADEADPPVLRLTEEDGDKKVSDTFLSADDEPAAQAMLEAVLLGNLPGMSGPWLTQYAQLLAQTEGPVILLHIGEEAIDLELVEPRAEAHPAPSQAPATVRIPPMRRDRTGLVGLIDALVRSEQNPARTILVRFDTFSDSQTLSRLAAMDDWTLLCGSDDASVAAAGRSLRNAVHTDPRLADRNVGVMVMGSDDHAAGQAAQRIASELEHDLANPVELVGHLKRMQPVQVRDLGSFPDPVGLWPKLVGFFDALEVPEPLAAPEPVVEAAAEPTPEPVPEPAPAPRVEVPAAASRPGPAPRFRQARPGPTPTASTTAGGLRTPGTRAGDVTRQATVPASGARRSPAMNDLSDTPMRDVPTPRVLSPQPELDLVALIAQGSAALDRPVALDARIPDQPDTQLAVDAQGVVHLMKHGTGVVSEDVMHLMESGQWVSDHLELIALTQRGQRFIDTAPVLHLLTDRADLTTQIAGRLRGRIRLHLLQQVTLGRETGWFCTPLG